jgi:hypothetical protein
MKHISVELAICMPNGTWHTNIVVISLADFMADNDTVIFNVSVSAWRKQHKDYGEVALGLYGYMEVDHVA